MFCANIEGHSEVYIINASGGSPRRLTFSSYSANPSWSRDGRWIFFDALTPTLDFCKVPAEGGPAIVVRQKVGWWAPRESPDGRFIYAIEHTPDSASLVRIPMGGGEKQLVLNSLNDSDDYALVQGGMYFIPKPDPKSGYSIQFLNATTGKTQRIASFENRVRGLAVSPDGRWILYARVDRSGSNLMLVENFR